MEVNYIKSADEEYFSNLILSENKDIDLHKVSEVHKKDNFKNLQIFFIYLIEEHKKGTASHQKSECILYIFFAIAFN